MDSKIAAQDGIVQKIFLIRGHKVMLSIHLAELYGVETKVLMQAVKRNIERFPEDFMFRLSSEEAMALKLQLIDLQAVVKSRSQYVTLKQGSNIKYLPYAFTEQGVAMLSSVLRSKRAIQVNIAIMRAFVKLKEFFAMHKELAHKLNELERKVGQHDVEIERIFDAIRALMAVEEKPKRKIGFHP